MSIRRGSFRPDELGGPEVDLSDADLAATWAAAREIEASLPIDAVQPSTGFADRVMAAVAAEPAPRRSGFLIGLRARPGVATFLTSVREAWAVAAGGGGRPLGARALAMGYVLAVLVIASSLTGVAAYGTAGALGLLDDHSPTPSQVEPGPTTVPDESPAESAGPSEGPDGSEEPSGSPEPSDTAGPDESGTSGDSGGPAATDDHGGSSPEPDSSPEPSSSPDSSDDSGAPSESPGA